MKEPIELSSKITTTTNITELSNELGHSHAEEQTGGTSEQRNKSGAEHF